MKEGHMSDNTIEIQQELTGIWIWYPLKLFDNWCKFVVFTKLV
jgi:hypothetical protein